MAEKQTKDLEKIKEKIIDLYFEEIERILSLEDYTDEFKEWFKNHDDFMQLQDNAIDDLHSLALMCNEIEDKISKKQVTLLKVFEYLSIAEGFMCNVINFIAYLLVLNEHDLFSIMKRGYVKKNINEVTKVETSTKLLFLEKHGFKELTKKYDSSLRNKLAHHDYYVDKEGKLWINGKEVNIIAKVESFIPLLRFFASVWGAIAKRGKEFLESKTEVKQSD